MMKRNSILIALTLLTASTAWAEEVSKDTIKVVDVEEVLVITQRKPQTSRITHSQHSPVTARHASQPGN